MELGRRIARMLGGRPAPGGPVVPLGRSELALPAGTPGPRRLPRRVCKLADLADWTGEEWLAYLDALAVPWHRVAPHRKGWEWAQGLYALEHLGLLHEGARALGVGAGTEPVLFFLTNRISEVVATDLYGQGAFADHEAADTMLTTPERHAPFEFRPERLTVMRMDGRALDFPDRSFDVVFSFSSIEHFGGHAGAARALVEMARVLRPGGALVITTELVLNGAPHPEFFSPDDLRRFVIEPAGLPLIEDVDYALSDRTLASALDCAHPDVLRATPHVLLRQGSACFTSICLVFQRASDQGAGG
jgi:SAM-dependent methyltransferase